MGMNDMELNNIIEQGKIYIAFIIALPFILIFLVPFALLTDYIDREEQKMHWGDSYPD